MSVSSSVGDFDLNLVKLRKPLEFADGTIQDTAYTGDGSENLAEVLAIGNNASNQDILGVRNLQVNTQIQLTPAGDTINFQGEINQVAVGTFFNGNQLQSTIINSGQAQSTAIGLSVRDVGSVNGLSILPNSTNNSFNPIINAGDIAVVGLSTTQSLAICADSATTNGIRISDAGMVMGVGGTGDTPSQNITINNPANTIVATTTGGMTIQSSSIAPTPTLRVSDTTSGQALYLVPKDNVASYNPISIQDNQQIIAWSSAGPNTQTLELAPHSSTSCGIRLQSSGTPYAMIGCGGTSADPSVRVECNRAANQLGLTYGSLGIGTAPLPNTAGASAGLFLPVSINGVNYKIALLLA